MRLFARFAQLFAPRWPEGEPLVAAGIRYGTRFPSGDIVFAPNAHVEPLRPCSCKGQLHEAHDA
jgi:hypothetical protein